MDGIGKKLVVVTWLDSKQTDGRWQWVSQFEARGPHRCYSVGWLMHEDDESVNVAQSYTDPEISDGDRQCAGVKVIPRKAVESIDVLQTDAAVTEAAE